MKFKNILREVIQNDKLLEMSTFFVKLTYSESETDVIREVDDSVKLTYYVNDKISKLSGPTSLYKG